MINFRFHIVSLTAVLLALGLGLVLGTTFLDNATVDVLRRQLDDLEIDLDKARQRNDELNRRLGEFEDEAADLHDQLGERLFDGLLAGDPVLVIAPEGVDEALVDDVVHALDNADADLVGTWWLTEKLALHDDGQVADLADALGLSTDDAARLGRHLSVQVADVLYGASEAMSSRTTAPADDKDAAPAPTNAVVSGAERTAPTEPEIIGQLRAGGFIEYDLPDDHEGDVVLLPPAGLRIVIISDPGAVLSPSQILVPVLADLASDGPVPVVVTEPAPEPDDGDDTPPSLVEIIRDGDDLSARVSTVDDLDRVSGRVATLLATVDAVPGDPAIGHYGTSKGTRLLPPPREGG